LPLGRYINRPDLNRWKAAGIRLTHLADALARAVERHPAGFGDQLAAITSDLQPVGARRLAGGGDEVPGRSAGILQAGADLVLHLDRVRLAARPDRRHPAGHPARRPLQQVQVVWTLVDQHAAALALPGGTPAARGVIAPGAEPVGDDPADAA